MTFRMPSLNSLRVFEVAARYGSFVKAADELCVTHGAVSRQIKQLEASLGITLFERRNRAVFLTQQGEALQKLCHAALQELETGIRQLVAEIHKPPLVLSCEPTLAMRWLIPRLPAFYAAHPDIQLLLYTAGGKIDFVSSRVDVALRRNDFDWGAGCFADLVGHEWVGPVCVPDQASHPARLLHSSSRPKAWEQWLADSGQVDLAGIPSASYEHFYLSLQAASAGLGMAIASIYMVEEETRQQRLVCPYGFVEDGSSYVLLSAKPLADDDRQVRLLGWLREMFAQTIDAMVTATR